MIKGTNQSQAAFKADQDQGKNRLGKPVGPLTHSLASGKGWSFRASVDEGWGIGQ